MAIVPSAIQTKRTATLITKEILFLLFLLAVVLLFRPSGTQAATINVSAGSSSSTDGDMVCQLEEAFDNINSGTRNYADCVETGSYGTNDTINLPIGTITGPGSYIGFGYNSFRVVGQGRDQSILDDAGLYLGSGGNYQVQDLTMTGWGIDVRQSDLTVNNVEIDLEYSTDTYYGAIQADNSNVTIQDSYFHSMLDGGSGFGLVNFFTADNKTLSMDRTTLSQAPTGLKMQAMSGSGVPVSVNATIQNSTFTDLTGLGGTDGSGFMTAATGISAWAIGENDDVTLNYTTINNTFSNITNSDDGFNNAAAISESSALYGSGSPTVTVNHTTQNNLYAAGNGAVNYNRLDIPGLIGSGYLNGNFNTTSNGGNVSSDTSFSSYLTNPKDKHNQTSLASFLGILTDNGGPAPTLALTDGSPAIDAGTNVTGMTTDQRGEARPQGNAFDAGAYESAFSAQVEGSSDGDPISDEVEDAAPNNGDGNGDGIPDSQQPHVTSLPGANGKYVTLVAPDGTALTNTEVLATTDLTKQDSLSYPFGLVSFTLTGVDSGATVPIVLYIASSEPASNFRARKYDPNTQTYRDLPGASIESVTVAGAKTLKLTYDITDGGNLDLDGSANGTIVDPVGLASTNLANTGQNTTLWTALAGSLLFAAPIMAVMNKFKRRLWSLRSK